MYFFIYHLLSHLPNYEIICWLVLPVYSNIYNKLKEVSHASTYTTYYLLN